MPTAVKKYPILASAARTATPGLNDFASINIKGARNIRVIVDVTAVTLTPSVTPSIQGSDSNGVAYDLLSSIAAITATGKTIYEIGLDTTDSAGLAKRRFLPDTLSMSFTHADTDSITYSVSLEVHKEV